MTTDAPAPISPWPARRPLFYAVGGAVALLLAFGAAFSAGFSAAMASTSPSPAVPASSLQTVQMYAAIALGVAVVTATVVGVILFRLAFQVRQHLPVAPPDVWVRSGHWVLAVSPFVLLTWATGLTAASLTPGIADLQYVPPILGTAAVVALVATFVNIASRRTLRVSGFVFAVLWLCTVTAVLPPTAGLGPAGSWWHWWTITALTAAYAIMAAAWPYVWDFITSAIKESRRLK